MVSSRSRAARLLRARLGMQSGVQTEVEWTNSSASRGWAWHVSWSDGPTVQAMRGRTERLLREIGGLDPARLHYSRIVQPRALALAMVRNVRLGQPPLGHRGSLWSFQDALDAESYPERGSAEELALADRLGRLSGWSDDRMAAILDEHGVTARADPPGGNVISITRRPRRDKAT